MLTGYGFKSIKCVDLYFRKTKNPFKMKGSHDRYERLLAYFILL